MRFSIDYIATAILLSSVLGIVLIKRFLFSPSPFPSFAFSRLSELNIPSWRTRLVALPRQLHYAAFTSLLIAFIDPHLLTPPFSSSHLQPLSSHPVSTEGIAIYLVLDQSGSMKQKVPFLESNGLEKSIPKIDILKQVTKQFILNHPTDLIGLVSFARVPKVLVPLTLDQTTLLKHLQEIQVVNHSEEDGTAMGYAIFKTAHLIAATRHFSEELNQNGKSPYTIKSAIMIVVTDGFQNPSRLDQGNRLRTIELDDAAAYAKNQNIRLYVINIDPSLASAQYAPHRRQLQTITALTGGQFYLVDDNQDLKDIYESINQLEKGKILQNAQVQSVASSNPEARFSLAPFFILLGLIFFFAAIVLDSFILKVVP